MEPSMMLVYIILMISACCSCEPRFRGYARQGIPDVVPIAADSNNCVCIDKSGPSVPDALGSDQLRLVVYFYKDANNTLSVYTPNKEKQLLLPELGLGPDDALTEVDSGSTQVQTLFNSYNAVQINKSNVNGGTGSSNDQVTSDLLQNNPMEPNNLPNSQYGNIIPPGDLPIVNQEDNLGLPSAPLGNDDSLLPVSPIGDTSPISTPNEGLGLQTIPVDTSLETNNVENGKYLIETLDNLYSKSKIYNYITFDEWFGTQMQKIQNTGQSPKKNYNLSSLKQQIEKTLYDNGMYVTNDGVLIDSKGEALNVANLKLRPILIGDSVTYDSLLTVNGDKYELPSNLPYLEAVLVTLVKPPRILGMIPLGKTYVPRVSYRTNFDYRDLLASNTGSSCKTKQCAQQMLKANTGCNTGRCPQNVHYSMRQRYYPKSSQDLFRAGRVNDFSYKPVKPSSRAASRYGRPDRRGGFLKPGLQNDDDIDNILRTFFLFNKLKKHDKKVSEPPLKGSGEDTDVSGGKSTVEEGDTAFRIIGGNAATSSGTPVSSRGRSGYYGRSGH